MNAWVEAARPRTLSAGVAPVIVGTAAAATPILWRAVAALIVSLSLQVAVNLANDLFDAQRGVDTGARRGPQRAVSSGLISPRAMKKAIVLTLVVAGLAGLALAAVVGWELLGMGLAAMAAALTYSGGPRPYGSAAMGEVMVFLFFGVVATAGSAYVQDETLRLAPLVASIPVGFLAAAILVVNNLRDIPTDRDANKITVAVALGADRTVLLYRCLIAASFLSLPLLAVVISSVWPLLAMLAMCVAIVPVRVVQTSASVATLIAALGATARMQIVFAFLLAVGLWISS